MPSSSHHYESLRSPGQDGNKLKCTRQYYAIFGGVIVGVLLLNQMYYSSFLSSASSQVPSPNTSSSSSSSSSLSLSLPSGYDLSFTPLVDSLFHQQNNNGDNEEAEAFEWKKGLFARLDVIRRRCGAPCSINSVGAFEMFAQSTGAAATHEAGQTLFESEVRLEVPVSCRDMFELEEIDAGDMAFPERPPDELIPHYTLDGAISFIFKKHFKQAYLNSEDKLVWTKEEVENQMEKLKEGTQKGSYSIEVTNKVRDFVLDKMSLTGKSVLVIGSERPWLEATALLAGASKVTTLEYAEIESQHPQIVTFTPQRFREAYLNGSLELFDAILSHSSLEHSGLGRYGDALNPWGDVLAVNRAWCVTKNGGSLMLGVPTCTSDEVLWNIHRCYGPLRWPLITMNWAKTDGLRYGYDVNRDELHAFQKVSH